MSECEMTDVRKGGRKTALASNDIMLALRSIQRRLDRFFGSPLDRPVYSGIRCKTLCSRMNDRLRNPKLDSGSRSSII